jgi:DNA polymerase-3 subunit gamma/tau
MGSRTLHNKYAPKNFDEVIGQDTTKMILKNFFKPSKTAAGEDNSVPIPNGMIFAGPSGSGKTTMARIFAKKLLGEQVDSTNFLEINAAQNNGVEYMKSVVFEQLKYRPIAGKYKLVLFDEAHMLSRSAFDALLNILQEPSDSLIFIFTTTREDKIPETIKSRCMLLKVRRLSSQELRKALIPVLEKEKLEVSDENKDFLIRECRGNLRQMFSLLDKARFLEGSWYSHFKNFSPEEIYDFMLLILEGKLAKALENWSNYENQGYEEKLFFRGLAMFLNEISGDLLLGNTNSFLEKYHLSNELIMVFWDILLESERALALGMVKVVPMCIKRLTTVQDRISLFGFAEKILK